MTIYSKIIGKGTPLVILHGFLGMGDNWKTLGRQFAADGYEVHLVDQRNHGRSFHSEHFNYSLLVEDLKVYCDEKGLDQIHLLGHSMGGKTAMLFAVTYPELVKKLIIADIGVKAYPQHHQQILEGLMALSKNANALSSRTESDNFLSTYVSDEGTRMFLLKNLYWKEKGVLALRMNLPALVAHIEEIGKPLPDGASYSGEALFLKGEKSNYILLEDENEIFNAFAKAKLKPISKAGHWLHAENPKDFYKEVINFL
ncbi:alpha/beta fold hydrolase [Dokdonia sp. Hel_I_53]|uniref:alpha/beta fold hydrolase n=1 Tax=Dokdonia sp. Hel_I_53 TaxID=1566287 RepID=UPI00119C6131|nr:alpha/beta fold hydrolase [Dokdonia sp. Hel_I_53]TVZ52351.1 pimeloyl-ACP methyl ester carboxylesterase [Dokdonia sp. Hel_I_53]